MVVVGLHVSFTPPVWKILIFFSKFISLLIIFTSYLIYYYFYLVLLSKELSFTLWVQRNETKKNANTLRSYSARSRSYDEELGLVVTRASDRLRHLTLLSVAALNASSAIVCSLRSVIAAPHWRCTSLGLHTGDVGLYRSLIEVQNYRETIKIKFIFLVYEHEN